MKKPTLACALLACGLAASSADAAVVYLKDGSRLTGTVVGATARDIQLYTPDGTLRISTDRIASIDYQGASAPQNAPPAAQPPEAPPVYNPQPAPVRSRFSRGEREELGPNYISLDFGIAAPLSDISFPQGVGGSASNGDVGADLGFQYARYVTPHTALGVDFQWLDRSENDTFNLLNAAGSRVTGDSVVFMGILKYDFLTQGDARPYAILGAGIHHTNETIDAAPNEGFVWSDTQTSEARRLVDDSATGAAGSIRLGVDLYSLQPSVISFEVGWTALAGASYHATTQGQAIGVSDVSGPLNFLTILFKWGWRF